VQSEKANILIVDDEKGLRIGTQRLLEDEGYVVDTAENGTQGIKLGTANNYDVAVIDLKMPDVDGLDVLKEIKIVHPNTICFITTAFASYDTAIQSTRLGAFGYIQKPFTPEEYLYQVETGVKQHQLIVDAEKLKLEREESLLEIANEKSRLNAIIKSISDGVLVINKNGEVAYYNYAALKFLNITSLNIGEEILDKLPNEIVDIVTKLLHKDKILLKTYTTQIETQSAESLSLEAACTPVPNPDGSLAGVVIVLSNITQFKKIEQIKSQFISMVAHELKTPLAAIQGFLNILLDKSIAVDEDKRTDYLNRSVIRLKNMILLVNDLLDISRMENKTKQREIQATNIIDIIENTLQLLELDINKRQIVVEKNFEKSLPKILVDQNEIMRLVTNLLSNAIKYNRDGGKIFVSASKQQNYLTIKVQDSGIGMKPEEKQRLFNEFYRAKNDMTRGISGTGLGLTIVKRIVDSYHGKIEVDSEFGVGTSFTINLPINNN
jgi:two-component system, OmpR family, phosphate regulon sensor histidine kinase PhoR